MKFNKRLLVVFCIFVIGMSVISSVSSAPIIDDLGNIDMGAAKDAGCIVSDVSLNLEGYGCCYINHTYVYTPGYNAYLGG